MKAINHTPGFVLRRKLYLLIPVMVIPPLLLLFYALGGGRGQVKAGVNHSAGYNAALPEPATAGKNLPGKMVVYQQADADTQRLKESIRVDPYRRVVAGRGDSIRQGGFGVSDSGTELLLRRLAVLKQAVQTQAEGAAAPERRRAVSVLHERAGSGGFASRRGEVYLGWGEPDVGKVSTEAGLPAMDKLQGLLHAIHSTSEDSEVRSDPQMDKLNGMLDKIIRIQHPEPVVAGSESGKGGGDDRVNEVLVIPAVVQEDQVLSAGSTIALRFTDSARIGGVLIGRDQLVYGLVGVSHDRMNVSVPFIRVGNMLIPSGLQVYDMDGLPGIHIPSGLTREVARESADEGIGSLSVVSADPSLGAQAASAGIQTARNLLSRKVRTVKVAIHAGYQVLLRDGQGRSGRGDEKRRGVGKGAEGGGGSLRAGTTEGGAAAAVCPPADALSWTPFLHDRSCSGKVELFLEGCYLKDGVMWFMGRLVNHSAIDYVPRYSGWTVRDRHVMTRTAIQVIPMVPCYSGLPDKVGGTGSARILIGFEAFALPHDKELVWELSEGQGARTLKVGISEKEILKTRKL